MLGSSPRVWGQDGFLQNYHKWWRIIPTRVGTRWYTAKRRAAERDHPHACGDKAYDKWLTLRNGGSSPRVWGQERNGDKCDKKQRIIPTRVGTSNGDKNNGNISLDHPHACGDKLRAGGKQMEKVGSSPRVWGQGYLR